MAVQSFRSFEDRASDILAISQGIKDDIMSSLHTAMPGIIKKFDPATQTAEVQTTIRRRVKHPEGVKHEADPLLLDVPVCFLGGGSHVLTFPVQTGDECLVFFADHCIDAWYQSGGVQNQLMPRMHDISDGFALVGFRSKPNALKNFNIEKPNFVGGVMVDGKNVEGGDVAWEDITNKPTNFPPSSHTHTVSNITNFPTSMPASDVYDWAKAENKPSYSWNEIGNKPTTFPPTEHSHGWESITNKPTSFTPSAHTHIKDNITDFPTSMPASDVYDWAKAETKPSYTWTEIGSKPTNFPPSSHNHTVSNITDFPTSMPASDVHEWAKASTKPCYTAEEVGAAAASHSHSNYVPSQALGNNVDLNSLTGFGMYRLQSNITNAPNANAQYGNLLVLRGGDESDTLAQLYFNYNEDTVSFRRGTTNWSTTGGWHTLLHTGNIAGQNFASISPNNANAYLGATYVSQGLEKPNYFGSGKLKLQMLRGGPNNIATLANGWYDTLWLSSYTGTDVKGSNALVFRKDGEYIGFIRQNFDSTEWGTAREILHSGNYGNYAASCRDRVVTDFNHANFRVSGMYGEDNQASNSPGHVYKALIVATNGEVGLQITGGYSSDNLWFRGWWSDGSTYSTWRKILHDGNYSSYTLPLTGGTLTGLLRASGGPNAANPITLGSLDGTSLYISNAAGSYGLVTNVHTSGQVSMQVQRADGGTTVYDLNLQPAGGKLKYGTYEVLSTGNYTTYVTPSSIGAATSGHNHDGRYASAVYNNAYAYLGSAYVNGGLEKPSYFGSGKLKLQMLIGGSDNIASIPYGWYDALWLSSYTGTAPKGSNVLVFGKNSDYVGVIRQNYDATEWGTAREILHSGNCSAYALQINGTINDDGTFVPAVLPGVQSLAVSTSYSGFPTTYGQAWLFSGNTQHRAFALFKQAQSNNLMMTGFNSSGAVIGWNTLLSSGNYSSYALPLTGGTLSGGVFDSRLTTTSKQLFNAAEGNVYLANQNNRTTIESNQAIRISRNGSFYTALDSGNYASFVTPSGIGAVPSAGGIIMTGSLSSTGGADSNDFSARRYREIMILSSTPSYALLGDIVILINSGANNGMYLVTATGMPPTLQKIM